MKILTVASLTVLFAGQTPTLSAQEKTDKEVLALITMAKQQEQKIVRGRLKVQSQAEHLSPDSAAEQKSIEQSLVKVGNDKAEAAASAREFFLASRPETKMPPQNYTFAFDAAKMRYREDGVHFSRPYRMSIAGAEVIRGDSHQSDTIEGNPEISWEYLLARYKHPLFPAQARSIWMGRGWESVAPAGSTATFRILEQNADGTVVLLRSDKSHVSENAYDLKVWMDTKHGFTLTRTQSIFRKSGLVVAETLYTYYRREDDTYYPKEAVETRFHKNDAGKWVAKSRITSRITAAEVNVPLAQSEVEIVIPDGSVVHDMREGSPSRTYRQGESPPSARGQRD